MGITIGRSMLKRLGTRHWCVVLIVLTLFVILFFYTNVLPSTETLVSKNMIAKDVSSYTTLPQRKSLLIVGKGRSGTSFVSKMLAIGERVSKNNCLMSSRKDISIIKEKHTNLFGRFIVYGLAKIQRDSKYPIACAHKYSIETCYQRSISTYWGFSLLRNQK